MLGVTRGNDRAFITHIALYKASGDKSKQLLVQPKLSLAFRVVAHPLLTVGATIIRAHHVSPGCMHAAYGRHILSLRRAGGC